VAGGGRRGGTAILVVLALFAIGGLAAYLASRKGAELPFPLPKRAGCVINAETDTGRDSWGMDLTQASNAATITAVGIKKKVPKRGIVVALATAMQESKLENLNGGDRDSVGLFQQRPSQGWGTTEQISDPRYAATKFFNALLKIKGWEKMRITEAAQKVQRSAYPEAYAKWEDEATVVATALTGDVQAAVNCTMPDGEPPARGAEALDGLITALLADWGNANVTTIGVPGGEGVRLAAPTKGRGWQLAHWIVAQAAGHGVSRVAFDGREWRAESGEWRETTAESSTVLVEALA
jgi:hypothetical protein